MAFKICCFVPIAPLPSHFVSYHWRCATPSPTGHSVGSWESRSTRNLPVREHGQDGHGTGLVVARMLGNCPLTPRRMAATLSPKGAREIRTLIFRFGMLV